MVVVNIIVLFGVGIELSRIRDTNKLVLQDNARHEKTINLLVSMQDQGERFTAGNAWQLAQLALTGTVDMSEYPSNLIYPSGTWFNNWLDKSGLLDQQQPN